MNAAKPMLAINVTDLDKDPFLINTPEATIDMTKGLAGKKEHDSADLITKITACSPSEVGKAIWEDALDTFFLGDKELIEYVQITVGSAAVGKVFQEHMIIAYDGMFILFKTGLRISEFCGLTLSDIDFEEKQISVNHQLQRTRDMKYVIEDTKTSSGTRIIPMTEEVYECFKRIVENRKKPKKEPVIDGYKGFLFLDKKDMPEVALHWEKHFEWALAKHNRIYKEQLPKITPHVCRHTYCSNMAKSGMNPKTLQYLMGHSDISVTMNVYTHIGFDDAEEELKRMEEFRRAQAEVEQKKEKPMSQKMLNQNEIFLENEIQSFVSQLIGYKSKYNLYPHSIQCADSYYGIHSCKHWLDGTCDGHLCAESEIPELVMDDNYLL